MFDFGIAKVWPNMPGRIPGCMWSWTIIFRDHGGEIWHIIRRTGRLKRWV